MNFYKLLAAFLQRLASTRSITVTEPAWFPYMAAVTGVLAAVAGFLVVHSGNLANQAMIDSSLSTRAQTKASDGWSEYQANSIKARIVETAILTASGDARKKLQADADTFRARQPSIKAKAQQEEDDAERYGRDVSLRMRQRARLTYGMVAIQAAIGICSIAVMSKRHSAFYLSVLMSFIGVAITVYAFVMK